MGLGVTKLFLYIEISRTLELLTVILFYFLEFMGILVQIYLKYKYKRKILGFEWMLR